MQGRSMSRVGLLPASAHLASSRASCFQAGDFGPGSEPLLHTLARGTRESDSLAPHGFILLDLTLGPKESPDSYSVGYSGESK